MSYFAIPWHTNEKSDMDNQLYVNNNIIMNIHLYVLFIIIIKDIKNNKKNKNDKYTFYKQKYV